MTPDHPDADGEPRLRCWACAELVHPDARKCRWCGEWYGELAHRPRFDVTAATVHELMDRPIEQATAINSSQKDDDFLVRADPTLVLELGEAFEPHFQELEDKLYGIRRRVAERSGVVTPEVLLRRRERTDDGRYMSGGQYQIRVHGDLVADGEVLLTHSLGVGQGDPIADRDVVDAIDPIWGLPAIWVPADYTELGEQNGWQMFDPLDVIATHVNDVVTAHLGELLDREATAELLNLARRETPMVVQELVPNLLSLGQIRQVFQSLVREQVPLTDMSTILNALADNAVYTKDPLALAEHVRAQLGRKICARYQSPDGTLKAFMLSPDAERAIQNAIQLNETGQVLMLNPNTSQAIQNNLAEALRVHRREMLDPILIAPPKIRRHVQRLLERNFSRIVVLSYSEIVAGTQIDNLETIEADAAGTTPTSHELLVTPETIEHPTTGSGWLMYDDGQSVPPSEGGGDASGGPNDATDWNW
jgi:flagellar biosynthesis component FlhA